MPFSAFLGRLTFSLALLSSLTVTAQAAASSPPRVAVFSEPGFPSVNISALVSPAAVAADLQKAGLAVDVLDAAALQDPAKLNSKNYAAVVLPYGNAYPQAAFANLRAFHQAGGDFVLSGIPFTHAVTRNAKGEWHDEGNDSDRALFIPSGIGVGGFRNGPQGSTSVADGDPLGLAPLALDWGNGSDTQTLDTATLPSTDRVVPILVADGGSQPVSEMVVHGDSDYRGAVDVWTPNGLRNDDALIAFATEQLIVRGTVAALAQQGLLSPVGRTRALAALDALPRPHIDANLILPATLPLYPTLQPKLTPLSRHLYVADVRHLPQEQTLLLASVQGIVNRRQPRIYLITGDEDQFWLDQMQAQYQTDKPIFVSDPLSLIQTFRAEIKGAVVADPNVYVSPCIAVDIAGMDDLAIATPALASRLGLPIVSDLRGKFTGDADALRYARTQLLPHLNPFLSLCLDPPLLGSQVDDIVAARGTCFWITGPKAQGKPGANEAAERAEITRTFAQMPLNSVVRGFWWHGDGQGLDETPGVALGSHYGKITTVSDYVANFSVSSSIWLRGLKQHPQPPAPSLDRRKVYIAITLSDGDNFAPWRGVFRQFMAEPLYGTIPVAFGMGPSLVDAAPNQAQWYYAHAAPTTEFLCDVSGAGYIYPTDWAKALADRPAQLQAFYKLTSRYMDRMDMHTVRLMNVGTTDISTAGADLPSVPFLMPDYGLAGESGYGQYTYTLPSGQPVFRGASDGPGGATLAAEIRAHAGTARPAFLNSFVYIWGAHMTDLKQMLTLLGPDYIPVTPTQLNTLYREAQKP